MRRSATIDAINSAGCVFAGRPSLVRAKAPPASNLPEGFVEGVAGAANGADRITFAPPRQRLAQPPDVDVDGALVDLRRLPPNRIEQLGAREHPAGLFEQIFEQPKIGRAEADVALAAPGATSISARPSSGCSNT